MYKAFISYRKSYATNADLIKKVLVKEYGFSNEEIFLDKHNIGPEYFDDKIKQAIKFSSSLILVVTKDCFIPKNDDWFIQEVKTALDNNKTIIPIFFDGIENLSDNLITEQLKLSFTADEIKKIQKSQGVIYNFDLSDATFVKLVDFINRADKSRCNRVQLIFKAILLIICCATFVFAFFIGVGFLWGYFSSNVSYDNILIDNTYVNDKIATFEFGGLRAEYDFMRDSISVHTHQKLMENLPQSSFDTFIQSCSVSGAIAVLNKNISHLKYLKYFRGGSKYNNIIKVGVTVAVCIGSVCGFAQGSKYGQIIKQQKEALMLYPKLVDKTMWNPVITENIELKQMFNLHNMIVIKPDSSITVAKDMGLNKRSILLKYNEWEIGNRSPEIRKVINESQDMTKEVVFMEQDSINTIKRIELPQGIVGIVFSGPELLESIKYNAIDVARRYNEWKLNNIN